MARDQKVKNKAARTPASTPVDFAPAAGDPTTSTQSEAGTAAPEAPVQIAEQKNEAVAPLQTNWPTWPTSRPGPRATPPPPGMRSFNPFRPEQVSEVGYNQETGEPVSSDQQSRSLPDPSMADLASFDQKPTTGQEMLGKRKKRL
ncbi:hypothetical protein [Dictyobacter aurantiacus]|uniref:Uncharacterized protein n=1 Tax=Dictyobacter aurantiacus TaxID=1936993 RepID=A0A401ZD18_9CHLR|nr:hypothetical protein [Dictyobacter aurantiacus]GCE04733.1 hypothetical protein KDAU_20620 [Dictyobacter aurantiacus]